MQLDFFIAPVPRAIQAPVTHRARPRVAVASHAGPVAAATGAQRTVAEMLDSGSPVEFPKNANAIRVTIGTKTIVLLKADADTLKGAGIASVVEFGTVRNDAKGHPVRKEFEVLVAPPPSRVDRAGELFDAARVLDR